ncbi:MAG: ATP-binding protein [Lachnospiraceae bacterium]|nr:ATP-binding protein [Lachnospiraceae bacterium]
MRKTVAIGIQDYQTIIEQDCFYIDKTDFIREWWESKDCVTLITRPRRFGKTLNMSMTEKFFSLKYAERGDLFEGMSIWNDEKYRSMQGTWPVIALSFAAVKETDFATAKIRINQIIERLYIEFEFIRDSDRMTDRDRRAFDRISTDMPEVYATYALNQLSDYLYRYYGRKVLILLDEYDTPMQEAYVNGYWNQMVNFMRNLFNSTFKTNPWLERALLTGITRVSKESVFSDMNNLELITTTSDKYETSFGFTENEVFDAMDLCGLGQKKESAKFWYDGFCFGRCRDIYNPWSILNFLDKGRFDAYWANTSANSLVSKLIREGGPDIKKSFEKLLLGETLRCVIDEQVVYDQLDGNESAIWSLLLACGYLKVLDYEEQDQYEKVYAGVFYELAITNFETRQMFERMVSGWFEPVRTDYNDFIKALLLCDRRAMNRYMNRVALQTFSFFDTGKQPSELEPERFYHGFVLGLIVDLRERYRVLSNRESGFGRYDVVLEPRNPLQDPAFILEFKVHDPEREETLDQTVQDALGQIGKMRYTESLIDYGVPKERIYPLGFAFEGKTVLIG